MLELDICPEMLDIQITQDHVINIAGKVSGSAGTSGIDSFVLSHWLLRYEGHSKKLRFAIVKFIEELSNEYLSLAAYRTIICYKLVGLDKIPGV